MKSKVWLSKSAYLKGIQCEKALYLHKHHYTKRDKPSRELQNLFDQGHAIEDVARERYFPNGLNLNQTLLYNGQK